MENDTTVRKDEIFSFAIGCSVDENEKHHVK